MPKWLSNLLGSQEAAVATPSRGVSVPPHTATAVIDDVATPADKFEASPAASTSKRGNDELLALLTPDQEEFLAGLIDPPNLLPLDSFPPGDRQFLGGIQKRWHARRLELPVLPQAAIRLQQTLRSREVPIAHYVELVGSDPALVVEVLRSANSGLFANTAAVTTIHEAILRIGLRRLESVLVMAQLKAKVLKGGATADKAAVLMEMVPALGLLATRLARSDGSGESPTFMRGTLLHVEHMVILGAVAEVSRDSKDNLKPSVRALLQACERFGQEIREAVAKAWNLQEILLGTPEESGLAEEYAGFRKAVIRRWLDQPLPALKDIDPDHLHSAMETVEPRTTRTLSIVEM